MPQDSAQEDRRKAERVPCEPLRVRINVHREGILVDLSEGGALVQVRQEPLPVWTQVTLAIEWKNGTLHLPARLVRSVARRAQDESAAAGRTEYLVALEFLKPGTNEALALDQLIRAQTARKKSVEADTVRMKRSD